MGQSSSRFLHDPMTKLRYGISRLLASSAAVAEGWWDKTSQLINQYTGLVCMHIHGRIIGAHYYWFPAFLGKKAKFSVPVSIAPHGGTIAVASSLTDLIMLKALAYWTWQGIRKHTILWLIFTRFSTESLCSYSLAKRCWNDWKAQAGDMHCWLWLVVLQWCSRWHRWLFTIIQLTLQEEWTFIYFTTKTNKINNFEKVSITNGKIDTTCLLQCYYYPLQFSTKHPRFKSCKQPLWLQIGYIYPPPTSRYLNCNMNKKVA